MAADELGFLREVEAEYEASEAARSEEAAKLGIRIDSRGPETMTLF